MMKCEWILCPVCGSKTRNKIRKDTVLENYPLYCPKCRQERLIKVDNLKITVIKERDAEFTEPMKFWNESANHRLFFVSYLKEQTHQIKKTIFGWVILLYPKLPSEFVFKFGGIFYVLFLGSYLSAHTKQNLSIHSISENGRKPVKKISASATVLLTLKVEVQSPYNRITISYNRKGHRAFAVFLLSIFVGKCRRAVSDMRCRSPPLHLDFLHFKNSDGRYLW